MEPLSRPDIIITHAPCSDGFGAAWACWQAFGDDIRYMEGNHSEKSLTQEEVVGTFTDKKVAIFDFSYSLEITKAIASVAKDVRIFDHHPSAAEALVSLDYCYFDMEHSGAVLAWHACHPGKEVPQLLKYVQDRDLFRFELPYSHAISTYIYSQKRDFQVWSLLAKLMETEEGLEGVAKAGKEMLDYEAAVVQNIVSLGTETWQIGEFFVPAVNAPLSFRSAACALLERQCEDAPFVAAYSIEGGKAVWSLRCTQGEKDVSKIAAVFEGGGGHRSAAGFSLPLEKMNLAARRVEI